MIEQTAGLPTASKLFHGYRGLLRRAGIPVRALMPPTMLSAAASLFEGLSLALLIPLIHGFVNSDFSFLTTSVVLGEIVSRFPNWFSLGNRNSVVFLLSLTFFCAGAKVVFQYLAMVSTSHRVRRFTNALRKLLFARFLHFGKLYFDRVNSGYLQYLLSTAVTQVARALEGLQGALYALTTLTVYLFIMVTISWRLSLVVLTVFPVLHLLLSRLIGRIQLASADHAASFSTLAENLANSLSIIPLVKAYSHEAQEIARFEETSDRIEQIERSIDRRVFLVHPVQEIVSLCYLFLLVGLISLVIKLEGQWNIAGYMVFLLVLRRSAHLFGSFNTVRSSLAQVHGPIAQIEAIFDDEDKFSENDGEAEFVELGEGIVCRDLSYTYPGGTRALNSISCVFPQGKATALVGQSGGGKSTLLNVLMRFYEPPEKSVFVDGNDLLGLRKASWRDRIALVSQDALLFHGTLRDNLVYGLKQSVSDGEILAAVQQARLGEFLKALPRGLDTLLGDRGVQLSGGEKQRVSIARAILKRADILFLDEATSALDSRTEREIREALEQVMRGRTTILIAHRLSTVRHADKVIVMEAGRIVEQGKPDELIERRGRFFEYCEEQKSF